MLERAPGFPVVWKGINPTVTCPTRFWFYLLASLPVTRIIDWEQVDVHSLDTSVHSPGFSEKGQLATCCLLFALTLRRVSSVQEEMRSRRRRWQGDSLLQWEQCPWHIKWSTKWWHLFRPGRALGINAACPVMSPLQEPPGKMKTWWKLLSHFILFYV